MTPFAAVLLAGGQSQRMGRDKALLPLPDGRVLWQRQLAVLQELAPAELFISGPARDGFPPDIPLLPDDAPGLGPLAGIAAALATIQSKRLVVLAVDLPSMTAGYLRGLLDDDGPGVSSQGIVPQLRGGFLEPLAATYPKTALVAAQGGLRRADRSLQTFARVLIDSGQVRARPVSSADTGLFVNWNEPGDFQPR